jgi:hypothetical protein
LSKAGRKRSQTVPPKTTSFSTTRARIGGRGRLPASWRYLAKARLQPPVEIGDEIMNSDRTNGLAITSKIAGYELFLLEEVSPYET